MDFQMGTKSYWGTWGDSGQDASAAAACNLTPEDCAVNCVLEQVPVWAFENMSDVYWVLVGAHDCNVCFEHGLGRPVLL